MHLLDMLSSLSFIYPGLPGLLADFITTGGRLTSQETLGFSRLGIPILLESHDPHQDSNYEDCPSAQFSPIR
jgi:hypothetical protein